MRELIVLVAILICPVVMGTMMLLMWRGMKTAHPKDGDEK